jgi:hypothetical protein
MPVPDEPHPLCEKEIAPPIWLAGTPSTAVTLITGSVPNAGAGG